jgi:hypothetical protein
MTAPLTTLLKTSKIAGQSERYLRSAQSKGREKPDPQHSVTAFSLLRSSDYLVEYI